MNKKAILIGILILLSITNFISAVPKIEPYVNDFGNLLTKEDEIKLNLLCDEIEKNTTWEIAIVTLKNTEGIDRISYGNMIGDENGVGKLNKDNGVVIIWSLENEKGGAIATGRYSESILNDAKVGRIGRDAKHFFDEDKYYEGFNFIVNEINKEISDEDMVYLRNEKEEREINTIYTLLCIIGVIVFTLLLAGLMHIVIHSCYANN